MIIDNSLIIGSEICVPAYTIDMTDIQDDSPAKEKLIFWNSAYPLFVILEGVPCIA